MGTGVNTLIMMGLLLEDFYALAKRHGAVAWIVSHCTTGSERERYKLCKFGY